MENINKYNLDGFYSNPKKKTPLELLRSAGDVLGKGAKMILPTFGQTQGSSQVGLAMAARNPLDTGVQQGPAFGPFSAKENTESKPEIQQPVVPPAARKLAVQPTASVNPVSTVSLPASPPTRQLATQSSNSFTSPENMQTVPQQIEEPEWAVKTEAIPEPTIPENRNKLFGGMNMNQGIRMAGALAHSLAPNDWGGRMGKELMSMADTSDAEQRQNDLLKYQQESRRFNTVDDRIYGEEVGKQSRKFKVADDRTETASRLKMLDHKFNQDLDLLDREQKFRLANREQPRATDFENRLSIWNNLRNTGQITQQEYNDAVLGKRSGSGFGDDGLTTSQEAQMRAKLGELSGMGISEINVDSANAYLRALGEPLYQPQQVEGAPGFFGGRGKPVTKYVQGQTLESPSEATKARMLSKKGDQAYEAEYIKRFGSLPY